MQKKILEKIKEYNKIIIFRHKRPDGDCVGSTNGLKRMLELTYPEKTVVISAMDKSEYLSFVESEVSEYEDDFYKDALGIVIDTATAKRISSEKFNLCKELIKIDHHIEIEKYGDMQWVEELRCSASEMIADFYVKNKDELKLDKIGATYIYMGIVTDSGRFRYRDVSGETMHLAGELLTFGIDTDTLFAHLYLKDFNQFKFESYVYNKMKITENGVAYIFVDKKMQKKFNLSSEDASASVSYLDSIKGSLIWLAFIENDDGSIRVRLRSRFVTVSEIAERYNGGGHACAAGATVYSKKELKALLGEADLHLKNYKENNTNWL